MQHYGIRGQVYKWFHSYLTNRTQSISGAHSKLLNISYGVPQGSILGPILFLLYINDITTCSNTLKFTLFADDTSLLCENKTIALLETSLNNELKNVATWITSNKLSLNINKSNFILFSNDKIKHSINIKYNNKSLERKTCCKYLGVWIDEKLSWEDQISTVYTKICQGIGIISKLRHLLSPNEIKNIYYSYVQSHLLYGIIIWGNAKNSSLNNINKLLYKCSALMTFSKKNWSKELN